MFKSRRIMEEEHIFPPRSPVALGEESLRHADAQSWLCGDVIYHYESGVQGIFYVIEGEAHLTRLLEQGVRKTLHVVCARHFFLEGLLFWPEARVITVHAQRATRTAFFPRDVVERLVEEDAIFRTALLQSLAAKAINAGFEVVEMAYSDACSRMRHVLGELARMHGKSGDSRVEVPISQGELAERMGLHPVSVNRALRRLESMGHIKTGRQRILVYLDLLGELSKSDTR